MNVLDLYCGAGGLSAGFELLETFRVVAGLDHFEPAVKTFYRNHVDANRKFASPTDITSVRGEDLEKELGKIDIVIGGPPCQGFSHAGPRTVKDARRDHVWEFARLVSEIKPKAFVMENVNGLLVTGQKKRGQLLEELTAHYEKCGYRVVSQVLDAADYLVPQRRKRLFIVGVRSGKFEFPLPMSGAVPDLFHRVERFSTVSDALGDLPEPKGLPDQPYEASPHGWLQQYLRHGSNGLNNHTPSKHSPDMLRRLSKQEPGTRLYPNWNHSWFRLILAQPSPAVKENHRAPFVHPTAPRVTTPRECARLQTFPDWFVFEGTKTAQLIQIGNAVPALLGLAVATALAKSLGASLKLTERAAMVPSAAVPTSRAERKGRLAG
ncbi:MAG: DNA cytosine methyltransferase [Anaeromyxobacter sp.]|nr:DNA cytosine methyltransferase [Anaeromyxobacter sp.]